MSPSQHSGRRRKTALCCGAPFPLVSCTVNKEKMGDGRERKPDIGS